MSQAADLRDKRARLVARAALEREQLSAQLDAWRAPLALFDKSIAAARYVRRHPEWLVAVAVVIALLRPRRALAWARRGFLAWRTWRWISDAARDFAQRKLA